MDMGLFRRGDRRPAGRRAADIDYCVLVATLQAMQLGTATARAGARCGGGDLAGDSGRAPLAHILLGAQGWQDAVLTQGGSFNPSIARAAERS